jgi:hypothetical protein
MGNHQVADKIPDVSFSAETLAETSYKGTHRILFFGRQPETSMGKYLHGA